MDYENLKLSQLFLKTKSFSVMIELKKKSIPEANSISN